MPTTGRRRQSPAEAHTARASCRLQLSAPSACSAPLSNVWYLLSPCSCCFSARTGNTPLFVTTMPSCTSPHKEWCVLSRHQLPKQAQRLPSLHTEHTTGGASGKKNGGREQGGDIQRGRSGGTTMKKWFSSCVIRMQARSVYGAACAWFCDLFLLSLFRLPSRAKDDQQNDLQELTQETHNQERLLFRGAERQRSITLIRWTSTSSFVQKAAGEAPRRFLAQNPGLADHARSLRPTREGRGDVPLVPFQG